MWKYLLLCFLFFTSIVCSKSSSSNSFTQFENIRLGKGSFEAVKNLHMNWYLNAMKALMGQLGKQLYNNLKPHEQRRLAACLNNIDDKSDLTEGAKCLITARNLASKTKNKSARRTSDYDSEQSSPIAMKVDDTDVTKNMFIVENDDENTTNEAFITNSSFLLSQPSQIRLQSAIDEPWSTSINNTADLFPQLNDSLILSSKPTTSSQKAATVLTNMDQQYISASKMEKIVQSLSSKATSTTQKPLAVKAVHRNLSYPAPAVPINVSSISIPYQTSRLKNHSKNAGFETDSNGRDDGSFEKSQEKIINRKVVFDMRQPVINDKRDWKAKKLKQWWRRSSSSTRHLSIYPIECIGSTICHQNGRVLHGTKHFERGEFDVKRKIGRFEFFSSKQQQKRQKRSSYAIIDQDADSRLMHSFQVKKMEKIPKLIDPAPKSLAQRVTHLIRSVVHGNETLKSGEWLDAYKRLLRFKESLEEKKKLPGAKVYERRLYDIVLDSKYPTVSPKRKEQVPDLLVSAYNLIDSLGGKHNERGSMNFKFLSPRFAPLMPDKIDSDSRHLSPSFLSFYKDDSPDNIASLPKMMEEGGLEEKDREAVIETVMDISGAKDAVNVGLDLLSSLNFTGLEGELLEVTSRLGEAFKELEQSLNMEQKRDIDNNGFSFLEMQQIRKLMKTHGVLKMDEVGFDVEKYENLTKEERHLSLWQTIEHLAYNGTSVHKRPKRQAIQVLAPLVLAPFAFSAIVGLSILGPVVLSPSIFSVLLLNPSLLGPFVLSPAFFLPFIISPYVLTPYVLSPIFGAPFILNPYVLSPNVINPYILSPLILSPYIFCPDVFSPQALGGPILSPSAFSPAFMTESVLMASVLSPSFMS